jgi:mxaA protein
MLLVGIQAAAQTLPTPVAQPTAAPEVEGDEAVVQQPRPFGYVLGDTLTQRVFLAPEFQPEALPPLERAGLWFARRSAVLKKGDDGRLWLIMDYQLVNAPQALMTVNLPAVTLKSKAGKVLTVSMWPISVAPLTPQHAFAKGGLQELRPDHPAPTVPTSMLQRQLQVWLTLFAVTVAAWLAWWVIRSIRAAANQPFAMALRQVRQAGDDSPDAWLALHRAFDRTAGRALQTSTLPTLFKQAPHFAAERPAIEQFYNQSNLRFFGASSMRAQSGGSTQSRLPANTDSYASSQSAGSSAGRSATPAEAPHAIGSPPAVPSVRQHATIDAAKSFAGRNGANSGAVELRALAATLRRLEKQHER